MNRAKMLALGLGLALVALFVAPAAGAQDGPLITVEPASVDAAGDHEFTVTGSGWTAAPPIFVLPCEAPASGDLADLDSGTCDTANLTPATPDGDGNFSVTVTYTVPEGGMAIAAGDAGQTESSGVLVTVGAGAAEEAPADEPVAEPLPDTGVESAPLAIAGAAILAAGTMVVGFSRKLR